MRKWFSSLAVLGLASAAVSAQTIPFPEAAEQIGYDDGGADNSWKINAPTLAGDAFSVDFDALANGRTLLGISVATNETGSGGSISMAMTPSNFAVDGSGATPDPANPFASVNNPTGLPGVAGGFCPEAVAYAAPNVTLGTDVHAVLTMPAGDSVTWLCSDGTAVAGKSYFTTNSYATTAIPFTVNWMIRAVVSPDLGGANGLFTINGSTAATVDTDGSIALACWTTAANIANAAAHGQTALYLQGITAPPFIAFLAIPGAALPFGLGGLASNVGVIGGDVNCLAPAGTTLSWLAFFSDWTPPLKPNGKPHIGATNTATVTFTDSGGCNPTLCFGQEDDGVLDGTIWKVQNPAGSQDWFNVKLGNSPGGTATSIEAQSWDFCGIGPCWQSVALMSTDLGTDATGGTPLDGAPLSSVGGASACMVAGSANWGYPATLYDIPDVAMTSGSALHIGTEWGSGDSCTWIASDTDGVDDDASGDCASIPGTTSYFTLDGYATPAVPFSGANWNMKLNWN